MSDLATLATLKSWVAYDAETDFPIQNLPYGVYKTAANTPSRIGVAIGDLILDLQAVVEAGLFNEAKHLKNGDCFKEPVLNVFMSMGKAAWSEARSIIQQLLLEGGNDAIRSNEELKSKALIQQKDVVMQLPAQIGDYTDFYASKNHAYNVGVIFRGKDNALQPNWTWLPVGYHGRASSVVVSGTPLRRPCGQLTPPDNMPPAVHDECKTLDYELELGCFIGTGNELGEPVDIADAHDKIFGLTLLNDWSARDIQKWEYVPLGPFGAKNFGTTISPWVVTMEALRPFAIQNQTQDPAPLPYLAETGAKAYNIDLQVNMKPKESAEYSTIGKSNAKHLYWTFSQMLAHHTVTGCNMSAGDLMGSGTISGTTEDSYGSLLEMTWRGTKPVNFADGTVRKFIQDGDSINLTGQAVGPGFKIGFGNCEGTILPSHLKAKKASQ